MKTTNTMKNLLLKGAVGVALLGGFTSSAMAIALGASGTAINAHGPWQISNQGEYAFQTLTGPADNEWYAPAAKNQGALPNESFQSFCLELSEAVGGIGVPISYIVNNAAIGGGNNNHAALGDVGDRVSLGTAWLYSQFARGILADYFSAPDRNVVAQLLQFAIWALEDEIPDPVGNPFFTAAANAFGGDAELAQSNAPSGEFGVYVLNNTVVDTQARAQDMLYYSAPDGGATVMLLGLSLTGLSLLARSKRLARTA